jgi:hypothetical protein
MASDAMSRITPGFLALVALGLYPGCQTQRPIYYWGSYESLLYKNYAHPGKVSPEEQIEKLQEDLSKAAATDLKPNPGLHAQLGYLYLQVGKADAAKNEFEIEKTLFPESAVLMDRMLQKLNPSPAP